MNRKVDIFETLKHIDLFDLDFINNLSEEERKSIPPYTIMLWMGGCKSPAQLRQLNVFVNSIVFELPVQHQSLLYKLLYMSGDGKQKRYSWIKKRGKSKKYAKTVEILRRKFNCSVKDALEYIPLIDSDYVMGLAMDMGEQDDTLKAIKKEFS